MIACGPRRISIKNKRDKENRITQRDEPYVLDLCDAVLRLTGLRQYRFDFLQGDPVKNGKSSKLPVDIYYPSLNLVVEYHERQHTEAMPIFDGRQTISGLPRGEQRKRYDERRRQVLPSFGISVVELSYEDFHLDARKRLKRNKVKDEIVVRRKLTRWLPKKRI
jgi:hypothetical protein